MILRQIYLVFRHFLPTFVGVILASTVLIYLQAETLIAILTIFFFGWLQSFIDKFREIGKQLRDENPKKTELKEPYVYKNQTRSERSIDIRDQNVEPKAENQLPSFQRVPWTVLVKALGLALGTAALLFLLAYAYVYFFLYP